MGLTGLELLQEEWQKLVEEREGFLNDVHRRKITFAEWNKRERTYAVLVNEALIRLKHAQTKEFCRQMVGRCKN